tara:strand:- start:230 stop:400 length:171 start_codon:yes stop_codon:yes gene_type:complete
VITIGILVAKRAGHHIVAQSVQGPHHTGVFTIPDDAIVRCEEIHFGLDSGFTKRNR